MRIKRVYMAVICFLVIGSLIVAGCNDKQTQKKSATDTLKVKRFGMVTGLKPEKVAYYKKLHAAVWPAVLSKIKACHIRNYSIYLQKIDGKYFLFSYFEYAGTNFERDMARMAADTNTQRWWKETDPTQNPLPEAAAQQKIWQNMEELFHTE
jgi:L-rhamnose mutarotase